MLMLIAAVSSYANGTAVVKQFDVVVAFFFFFFKSISRKNIIVDKTMFL